MWPLEVEPHNKLMEEEVKTIDLKIGAKPLVVIQNETIKIVIG
jgi:hypothetical protein